MPQKELINNRNYDERHVIPKVCSAGSQKWRRNIGRIDREMNHLFKVILPQRSQKLCRKVSKVYL